MCQTLVADKLYLEAGVEDLLISSSTSKLIIIYLHNFQKCVP